MNAKADDNPPVDVINAMVKQLLAERFKLKVPHRNHATSMYTRWCWHGRTGGLVGHQEKRPLTAWRGQKKS